MTRRLTSTAQLLATIPELLGCDPSGSLVVVGLGPRGAAAPLLRVRLDELGGPQDAAAIGRQCGVLLVRARASAAVVASFADLGAAAACGVDDDLRAFAAGVADCVARVDAWSVGGGRYLCANERHAGCCPPNGHMLPHGGDAGGTGSERWSGEVTSAGTEGAGDARRGLAVRRRSAAAAALRWEARQPVIGAQAWRLAGLQLWRDCLAQTLAGSLPADATAGKLIAALADTVVRDAVVVDLVPGQAGVAMALTQDPSAPGVRQALDCLLGGADPVAPDLSHIDAVVALSEHLATLAPAHAAPAWTIAGLAAWWRGDAEGASYLVHQAIDVDAGYRLAQLMDCALRARMAPGWLSAA